MQPTTTSLRLTLTTALLSTGAHAQSCPSSIVPVPAKPSPAPQIPEPEKIAEVRLRWLNVNSEQEFTQTIFYTGDYHTNPYFGGIRQNVTGVGAAFLREGCKMLWCTAEDGELNPSTGQCTKVFVLEQVANTEDFLCEIEGSYAGHRFDCEY